MRVVFCNTSYRPFSNTTLYNTPAFKLKVQNIFKYQTNHNADWSLWGNLYYWLIIEYLSCNLMLQSGWCGANTSSLNKVESWRINSHKMAAALVLVHADANLLCTIRWFIHVMQTKKLGAMIKQRSQTGPPSIISSSLQPIHPSSEVR